MGAFLAGIAFSGPAADRARSLLVLLRSVFAGTFFLFFGFQVDPGTIPQALPAAAASRWSEASPRPSRVGSPGGGRVSALAVEPVRPSA